MNVTNAGWTLHAVEGELAENEMVRLHLFPWPMRWSCVWPVYLDLALTPAGALVAAGAHARLLRNT